MSILSFEEFEAETLALITPPYVSKFGAVTWRATFAEVEAYTWVIKGIIPDGEATLVYGAPQVGKSFLVEDMANCIARGLDYYGHRVMAGGVVYVAAEGGKGFRKRQRAYADHHALTAEHEIPITVLTKRVDLFSNDVDLQALILEIAHFAGTYLVPLRLIVLDTWSAITPGAKENASEDVSKVRKRVMALVERFRCAVIVVHHKPKDGSSPRGHGSLTGDFETTIDCDWEGDDRDDRGRGVLRDAEGRRMRRAKLVKQREGDSDISWPFVLRSIKLGLDEQGDPITSCICEAPVDREGNAQDGEAKAPEPKGRPLSPTSRIALQCLVDAINEKGEAPIAALASEVPAGTRVVHYHYWKRRMIERMFDPDEDPGTAKSRKRIQRVGDDLLLRKLIGKENPFVWLGEKRHR